MNIPLVDIVLHVDEDLDEAERNRLEETLRQREGVVSVHFDEKKQHLMVVAYNPERVTSKDLHDSPRQLTRRPCMPCSAAVCLFTARHRNVAVALLQPVSITPPWAGTQRPVIFKSIS